MSRRSTRHIAHRLFTSALSCAIARSMFGGRIVQAEEDAPPKPQFFAAEGP